MKNIIFKLNTLLLISLLLLAGILVAFAVSNSPLFSNLDDFVLFAAEDLELEKDVQVSSGDLGSNNKITIDKNSLISGSLFANQISLHKGVKINGNVSYNQLKIQKDVEIFGAKSKLAPLPTLKGSTTVEPHPYSISVSGQYAYVVNYVNPGLLRVFDVSNPENPMEVGFAETGKGPVSVFVSNQYAYVINNGAYTFEIFDISNPEDPIKVSSVATEADPWDVYVSGKYAYVINNAYVINRSPKTLQIFDVSDPTNPKEVGSVLTGARPKSIYVSGKYAYVGAYTWQLPYNTYTLQIFDVSNPKKPESKGLVKTGDQPRDVFVSGKYAYVVNESSHDLQVFDVSNPKNPELVGSEQTDICTGEGTAIVVCPYPRSVYVSGDYAFVVNAFRNTLAVIDVSDPTTPTRVSTAETGVTPQSVYVSGQYAYLANYNSHTLQIFDISKPQIAEMPVIPDFEVGDKDYKFKGENNVLSAGKYRNITLEKNAKLILTGGTYNLDKLVLEENSRIIFSGPTVLNIKSEFKAQSKVSILPDKNLKPQDLAINYPSQKPVEFGKNSFLNFKLLAPETLVRLGEATTLRGQILAKKIKVEQRSILSKN